MLALNLKATALTEEVLMRHGLAISSAGASVTLIRSADWQLAEEAGWDGVFWKIISYGKVTKTSQRTRRRGAANGAYPTRYHGHAPGS